MGKINPLLDVRDALKGYVMPGKIQPVVIQEHDKSFKGEHVEFLTSEKGEVTGICKCGFKKIYYEHYQPKTGEMIVSGKHAMSYYQYHHLNNVYKI